MSGLRYSGQVRLLTLTSATEAQNVLMQRHFRMLYMRLKRRGLILDYVRCPEFTKSGLRHDHVLFRGSYMEQMFLSKLWMEIHGAPVIDIRSVSSRRRMAGYFSSYLAKSPCGRLSYSFQWVWRGFCRDWAWLNHYCRDYRGNLWLPMAKILVLWNYCLDNRVRPPLLLDHLCEKGGING